MIETLRGKSINLEPLDLSHKEPLKILANDDSIWTYFPYSAAGKNFDPWFERTLEKVQTKSAYCFAVRFKTTNQIVGSTRYYEIALDQGRLSIGHTFYSHEVRGTSVNPECKLLLLTHAFESLKIQRVEIKTDARNTISINALKKLGAVQEGVLRQHITLKSGYTRDTVMFSILASEWSEVKDKLLCRLDKI